MKRNPDKDNPTPAPAGKAPGPAAPIVRGKPPQAPGGASVPNPDALAEFMDKAMGPAKYLYPFAISPSETGVEEDAA